MDSDRRAIVVLLLVALIFALFIFAVGWLLTEDARAGQWVNIDSFKGLATHTNGLNNDMSVARGVDGWFVRSDGLSKPWFTKVRGNPVLTRPTYILGQNSDNDAVLLFSDNFFSMINNTIDPVGYAQTARADSAYTLSATDSILYNLEDDSAQVKTRTASHWWLMWTLTDRASVTWDSLDYAVAGFYSNRWLLGRNSTQTIQTRPMGFPVSVPTVDEGTGTLELDIDTTLIFDGTYIWIYSADTDSLLNSSTTTVTMPTYADTGRVINTYESGDSLIMVIDPPDSIYTQATEFWILWDDSLLTSHATPDSILSVIEYSTDSMRCIVLADTTKYKGVNHYHGRENGVGSQHMFYLLYKPGTAFVYKNLGRQSSGTAYSRDTLITTGGQTIGPLKFARWRTHAADGSAYFDFSGVADLDGLDTRITDRNVFQITTDVGTGGDEDTAFAVCVGYSSTSDDFGASWSWFDFILFDTDSIKASEWGHGGNALNKIIQRPRKQDWSITTISTTTSNDRFAVQHQQRAFSSGNTHINSTTGKRDSTTWMRYTRLASWAMTGAAGDTADHAGTDSISYKVFPKNNKFQIEGGDPITGLTSMGQTLNIYRRRGISQMTGFAQSQFSVYPAPVGQGAANHWCIARSPLHNQDVLTNENGIFFFGGSGLEPLTENVMEVLKDSINWYAENKLRASVYDNMYFVSAPFGSDTTNTRIIGIDLETRNAWLMSNPRASGVWNFRDDDGSEQQYFGDADSTVMWELGGSASNLYFIPEWKSSWSDLGDPEQVKQVQTYRIEFSSKEYRDTIFVDWYVNLSDTVYHNDTLRTSPLWTDTVPCGVESNAFLAQYPTSGSYPAGLSAWTTAFQQARSRDKQPRSVYRKVPRVVAGTHLSFGLRMSVTQSGDNPRLISRFGFEYQPIGARRR